MVLVFATQRQRDRETLIGFVIRRNVAVFDIWYFLSVFLRFLLDNNFSHFIIFIFVILFQFFSIINGEVNFIYKKKNYDTFKFHHSISYAKVKYDVILSPFLI